MTVPGGESDSGVTTYCVIFQLPIRPANPSPTTAISTLTETQLINAGDHAVDAFKSLTAYPAANEYLYLVAGDTTDADYTTVILKIELWGK